MEGKEEKRRQRRRLVGLKIMESTSVSHCSTDGCRVQTAVVNAADSEISAQLEVEITNTQMEVTGGMERARCRHPMFPHSAKCKR